MMRKANEDLPEVVVFDADGNAYGEDDLELMSPEMLETLSLSETAMKMRRRTAGVGESFTHRVFMCRGADRVYVGMSRGDQERKRRAMQAFSPVELTGWVWSEFVSFREAERLVQDIDRKCTNFKTQGQWYWLDETLIAWLEDKLGQPADVLVGRHSAEEGNQ